MQFHFLQIDKFRNKLVIHWFVFISIGLKNISFHKCIQFARTRIYPELKLVSKCNHVNAKHDLISVALKYIFKGKKIKDDIINKSLDRFIGLHEFIWTGCNLCYYSNANIDVWIMIIYSDIFWHVMYIEKQSS